MLKKFFTLICVVLLIGVVWIRWDSARGEEVEIAYDDGSQEQAWTGGIAGYVMAVCFTPSKYPCTLKKAKFYMNSVGLNFKVHVYQQDSDAAHPGLDLIQSFIVQPVITGWYTADLSLYNISISSGNFAIAIEYTSPNGPSIGSDLNPPISNKSWDYVFVAAEWVLFPENYMIRAVVDYPPVITTSIPSTTTTTKSCLLLPIYGEGSEEIELLRDIRDGVLSKSPEGQELIKMYYEWSPIIARVIEKDEAFKEEVKEIIDGILQLIVPEMD